MSTQLTSDAELWTRSLHGDERAFAGLFDRHKDRIFRHCLSLAPSRTEADDLTAVTFLELWRHRASVRLVDESILPWLLVTATHTARNAARSQRRYGRMLADLPHSEGIAETAEDEAIRSLPVEYSSAPLAKALNELSAKDQQLFVLVAVEGLTTAAAARALGIKPDAARTRLMRARKRLAKSSGLSAHTANATLS